MTATIKDRAEALLSRLARENYETEKRGYVKARKKLRLDGTMPHCPPPTQIMLGITAAIARNDTEALSAVLLSDTLGESLPQLPL